MRVSNYHTTVYSTSFMEALFNNLPNIFINVDPYGNHINQYIDNTINFSVNTPTDFLKAIKDLDAMDKDKLAEDIKICATKYYEPDAKVKMKNAILDIIAGDII
jgi:hypothetical protein